MTADGCDGAARARDWGLSGQLGARVAGVDPPLVLVNFVRPAANLGCPWGVWWLGNPWVHWPPPALGACLPGVCVWLALVPWPCPTVRGGLSCGCAQAW